MFGYIKAAKGDMKVKEYETYRAVYCSLCKYLGKNYGILSRFTLSYDFTFLTLLNIGMGDSCPEYKGGRCTFNPLKKCNYCRKTDGFEMPAAAAMIMFYYKLCDNIADSRGIKKAAFCVARAIFSGKHKKAAARFPQIEEYVSEYIKSQKKAESENTQSLDAAADPTAVMLGRVFALCSDDAIQKRPLERLGYCMGRYIYLLDAAADLESDIKSGNFNVLKSTAAKKSEAAERVKAQLYTCINESAKAFELIDLKYYKTILGNIIYLGLEETFLKELNDEKSL